MIKQAVWLLILSTVIALLVNALHPNKIDYIGSYRELSSGDGPIVPPTADPGDPPFIALDVAVMEFDLGGAIFVDARDSYEFNCGTIPGAINIPFDYLPNGDLTPYFDSCLGSAPTDSKLIVFCSGEECDLSLHLARNMAEVGYSELMIFFGGSREWEEAGLDLERREACDE
jgi:rhodanese-related sulfurtransferase